MSHTMDSTGRTRRKMFSPWLPSAGKTPLCTEETALFITEIPEFICGEEPCRTSVGTVCALGIRLNTLSIVTGKISRSATIPHSMTDIHFGAFLNSRRTAKTARATQPAEILIFRTVKNSSFIPYSPFEIDLSSLALRLSLCRKGGGSLQKPR